MREEGKAGTSSWAAPGWARYPLHCLCLAAMVALHFSIVPLAWWPLAALAAVHGGAPLRTSLLALTSLAVARALQVWFGPQTAYMAATGALTVISLHAAIRGRLAGTEAGPFSKADPGHRRAFDWFALGVTVLWALRRGTPIWASGAWMFMLAVHLAVLPPRWRKHSAYAVEYAVLAAATFVCFFILELGLRLLVREQLPYGQIFEAAPDYHLRLRPNTHVTHRLKDAGGAWHEWDCRISDQGFRDRIFGPKRADEFRVVMLGDSFTMGFVPADDTIPKQLERKLSAQLGAGRVSVVNAGMDTAGTVQEWGILRDRGLALNPDLVILQVFPSNDFDDCLNTFGKHIRAYSPEMFRVKQRWKHLSENSRPEGWEMAVRRASRLYREIALRRDNAEMVANWMRSLRFVPEAPALEVPPREERLMYMEVDLAEWYPELNDGFSIFQDYVLRIRDLCSARGVAFAAYCLPSKREGSDQKWQEGLAGTTLKYERGKACRVVEEFFEQAMIPYFRVADAIAQAGPVNLVYWPEDAHLTALGNGVVADRAAKFIADTFPALSQPSGVTIPASH